MRKAESGYSLVEVMVEIVVLTVAILPMVGMFEAALRAATTSGDYDRARACANQRLEQVKSLPYEAVKAGPTEGVCETSGFGYAVSTQFVDRDLQNVGDDRSLMKVTITVEWDDGRGLVRRGRGLSPSGVIPARDGASGRTRGASR